MNILLSAYHCAPNLGSESAVGWNYAVELKKQGHQVLVITSDTRKPFFLKGREHEKLGIKVIFYSLPNWMKRFYTPNTTSEHIYYLFWQIGLYFFCWNLIPNKKIDLIHHVTLGAFRIPSFLWMFNVPFFFGPVGGGEDPPAALLEGLRPGHRKTERFRRWVNILFVLNPFYLLNLYKSNLILLKNKDTLKYIPKVFHSKCRIDIGIGVPAKEAVHLVQKPENQKFRILYAGRLLYWKGIHLTIKALAELKDLQDQVEFTVVGSGPDEVWLKQLAADSQVEECINWIPKVDQKVLFQMYQDYDLLLFPSYHDSSGLVVIEAMSYGLPVICLDLGGPKEVVDTGCGVVINTKEKGQTEIVKDISQAISSLMNNPSRLYQMSQEAVTNAGYYTWKKVVQRTYSEILNSEKQYQKDERKVGAVTGKLS